MTANKLIDRFVEHGLLEEVTGLRRNRVFGFEPYLRLFDDAAPPTSEPV